MLQNINNRFGKKYALSVVYEFFCCFSAGINLYFSYQKQWHLCGFRNHLKPKLQIFAKYIPKQNLVFKSGHVTAVKKTISYKSAHRESGCSNTKVYF